MTDLTLYCFPSACSRATIIALEEAGARYDTRVANLPKGEQRSAEYLAINPNGKVPVLIVDGKPLTENVAILAYLADAYPEAKLLPSEPLARAEALSVVAWLASAVLTAISRAFRPERISDGEGSADRIKAVAREDIRSNLAIAEAHLAGRTWWLDQWSVADAYLYYIWSVATRLGCDAATFPNIAAHAARMEQRPATQAMLAWEKKAVEQLAA